MADTLIKLSGSTDGKGVKITATASTGTTVHTAHATSLDFLTLWAVNNDADGETRTLTLEWGTATAADGNIVVPVPCKVGPVMICERLPITNSLVVTAFSDETNDCLIFGHVVRVS